MAMAKAAGQRTCDLEATDGMEGKVNACMHKTGHPHQCPVLLPENFHFVFLFYLGLVFSLPGSTDHRQPARLLTRGSQSRDHSGSSVSVTTPSARLTAMDLVLETYHPLSISLGFLTTTLTRLAE